MSDSWIVEMRKQMWPWGKSAASVEACLAGDRERPVATNIYKYVNFALIGKASIGKTAVWQCRDNFSSEDQGYIKWDGPGGEYCYFATGPAKHCLGHLQGIVAFLEMQNKHTGATTRG